MAEMPDSSVGKHSHLLWVADVRHYCQRIATRSDNIGGERLQLRLAASMALASTSTSRRAALRPKQLDMPVMTTVAFCRQFFCITTPTETEIIESCGHKLRVCK